MNNLNIVTSKKDYTIFGLNANPFPYSGIPEQVPDIYVGQHEVMDKVSTVLSSVLSTGCSNHLILTGSYGNGKSHTLKYIQAQVQNQFSESATIKPVTGYVAQPGESFRDIYRDFIYDLGSTYLRECSREYIGKIAEILSENGKIEEDIERGRGWRAVERGKVLLSDIVPQAYVMLSEMTKYPDFSRAFLNLAYEENAYTSWEWLSGEAIEYSRRRELHLTSNITANHAQRAFIALKTTLEQINHSPVIMLIDEFECIETLQARTKQNMLNSLRHLIDVNPTGLSVIIACAPEVWETLVAEYHAFSDRIAKEANLKPLDKHSVTHLITEYLNTCRTTPSDSIEPFTEESIQRIFVEGNGNARRIITICGQAIDEALSNERECIDLGVLESMSGI
jgi:Cdc6-like AAA superfamily ATPase